MRIIGLGHLKPPCDTDKGRTFTSTMPLLRPRSCTPSRAFRSSSHSQVGIISRTARVTQRGNHDRTKARTNAVRALSGLTRSISQGPNEPSLLLHTIPEHFASIVSRFGDRPAVISRSPATSTGGIVSGASKEHTYTYESLDLESDSLALSLRSLGVRKGDRVAVSLGNCPEFAALTYAVFKLGAILVPLNPGFNSHQVAAALNHLEVQLLIIGAVTDLAYKPCRGRSNLPLLQELVPDLASGRIESPNVPTLSKIVVLDNTPFHPLSGFPPLESLPSLTPFDNLTRSFAPSKPVIPDSPLSASETINIQFTSGTTSQPKAAMLTHTNILNNGYFIAQRMGLDPTDLIVCPPPLFHCFGCVLGYMATATTGAAILFPSPSFDPLANLRMVADHRATGLYGVATMFVAMMELMSSSQASSSSPPLLSPESIRAFPTHLRKGIAAGSSVPESLMRKLYKSLGLNDLVICYGMTETSPVSCMTSPADPFEKRTGSVGKVMPHTRVKVVDPADRTRILPVGERGELATAGYLVMQGYWGDKQRTEEVRILEKDDEESDDLERGVTEGEEGDEKKTVWMYSGDEACMDTDGYVEITGRIKDLIIRGGENIHPLEIENCLFQHPLIAEVSVVGVSCPKYGEEVGAFVIVHKFVGVEVEGDGSDKGRPEGVGEGKKERLTKEEVREWVRTHLSSHLAPRHVFWVDEYPKTASGKIQKFKLRDMAKELLEREGEAAPRGKGSM